MEKRVTKRSPKAKQEILKTYENIAETIWRRWQIGPYQIKLKHVLWYLNIYLDDHAPGTRYRHWLRVADILTVLEKYPDWEPRLRGPWRHPNGDPFSQTNRGRKSKFQLG